MGTLPIDSVPVHLVVGERTSRLCHCRHLLFSFAGWSGSLMMKDQMEVGSLSRGVMLSLDSTPIQSVTGWRWLSPSSFTRTSIGKLCSVLSFAGEVRAYHVPREYQSGRGLVIAPVAQHLRAERSILGYLSTHLLVQA
jgi:hypothetical protein